MVTAFFREQAAALLKAEALDLGCEPEALYAHSLTIVPRPVPQRKRLVALAVDSGFGTVVSVEPPLLEWAKAHVPEGLHSRALQPFFMAELAAQALTEGFDSARAHGLTLGFALSEPPGEPVVPHVLRLVEMGQPWMAQWRPTNVFDNALGEPDEEHSPRTALVLMDATDEPLAVAAIWDHGWGREEIGVDVRRDARGQGLAKLVVGAATRSILAAGRVPYYSCGATNVRSHNNAIACGFLPVLTVANVWAKE